MSDEVLTQEQIKALEEVEGLKVDFFGETHTSPQQRFLSEFEYLKDLYESIQVNGGLTPEQEALLMEIVELKTGYKGESYAKAQQRFLHEFEYLEDLYNSIESGGGGLTTEQIALLNEIDQLSIGKNGTNYANAQARFIAEYDQLKTLIDNIDTGSGGGSGEGLTEEQIALLNNVEELKTDKMGSKHNTPQERFVSEYNYLKGLIDNINGGEGGGNTPQTQEFNIQLVINEKSAYTYSYPILTIVKENSSDYYRTTLIEIRYSIHCDLSQTLDSGYVIFKIKNVNGDVTLDRNDVVELGLDASDMEHGLIIEDNVIKYKAFIPKNDTRWVTANVKISPWKWNGYEFGEGVTFI